MRRRWSEGETARAVDGVDPALSPPLTLVFKASSDGREEVGPGEWAREEAMDGRGDDIVDIAVDYKGGVSELSEVRASGQVNGFKRWSVLYFRVESFPNFDAFL